MSTKKPIYTNENYSVVIHGTPGKPLDVHGLPYEALYRVINNDTDVVEYQTPALPDALGVAVQFDVALTEKTHEWMYKNSSTNAASAALNGEDTPPTVN